MEYNILKHMGQRHLNHPPTYRFLTVKFYLAMLLIINLHTRDVSGSTLGSKCQHDMDCTDFIKGSSCSVQGYCECAPYFVQYNITTCLSSQLLGGDCKLNEQCTMKVANSSCLDGACRCVEGFLQFRKHTCLGPAPPGSVCYSHKHCQMFHTRTHCDFLIPNLFGRCQCTAPAKLKGGICVDNAIEEVHVEIPQPSSSTTTTTDITTTTKQTPINQTPGLLEKDHEENNTQNILKDPIEQGSEIDSVSIEEQEWDDESKDVVVQTSKTPFYTQEEQTTKALALTPAHTEVTDHRQNEADENVFNQEMSHVTNGYPYKIEEEEHTEPIKQESVESLTEEVPTSKEEYVEKYGNVVDNTMNFDYEAAQHEMEENFEHENEDREQQQEEVTQNEQESEGEKQHELEHEPEQEHKEEEHHYEQEQEYNLVEEHKQVEQEQEQQLDTEQKEDVEQEHDENKNPEEKYEGEEQHDIEQDQTQEHQAVSEHGEEVKQEYEENENQQTEEQKEEFEEVHYELEKDQQQEYGEEEHHENNQEDTNKLDQEFQQSHQQEDEQVHEHKEEQGHGHENESDHEQEQLLVYQSVEKEEQNSGQVHKQGYQKEPEQEEKQEQKIEEQMQEQKEEQQQFQNSDQEHQIKPDHLDQTNQEQENQQELKPESDHHEQVHAQQYEQGQDLQQEHEPEKTYDHENIVKENNKDVSQQQNDKNPEQEIPIEAQANISEPQHTAEQKQEEKKEEEHIVLQDHIAQLGHIILDNDEINESIPPKRQQQESQKNNEESFNELLKPITNEIHDYHEHLIPIQEEVVAENESVQNENEATTQQQEQQQQPEAVMMVSDEVITTQSGVESLEEQQDKNEVLDVSVLEADVENNSNSQIDFNISQDEEEQKQTTDNNANVQDNEKEKLVDNDKQIDDHINAAGQIAGTNIVEQQKEEDVGLLQETTEEMPEMEIQTDNNAPTADFEDYHVFQDVENQPEDKPNETTQVIDTDRIIEDINTNEQQQQTVEHTEDHHMTDEEILEMQLTTAANDDDQNVEEQTNTHKIQHVSNLLEDQEEDTEHPQYSDKYDQIEQVTENFEHEENLNAGNELFKEKEHEISSLGSGISQEIGHDEYESQEMIQEHSESDKSDEEYSENTSFQEENKSETVTKHSTSDDHVEEIIQQQVNAANQENYSTGEHSSDIQDSEEFVEESTTVSENKYEKDDNDADDKEHKEVTEETVHTSEEFVQEVDQDSTPQEPEQLNFDSHDEQNIIKHKQSDLEYLHLQDHENEEQQAAVVKENEQIKHEAASLEEEQYSNFNTQHNEAELIETYTQIKDISDSPLKNHQLDELSDKMNDNEVDESGPAENQQQIDIDGLSTATDSVQDNEVLRDEVTNRNHAQDDYFFEDEIVTPKEERFKESESISDILNDLMKDEVTARSDFSDDSNYNINHPNIHDEDVPDLIAEDTNISEETVMSHEIPAPNSTETPIHPEDKLITFYPDMQEVKHTQEELTEEEASGDDQKPTEIPKTEEAHEGKHNQTLSPIDLPFDTSVDYEAQELEADNLVVETTTILPKDSKFENNNEQAEVTTSASAIEELTTQTLLNLASRVTLMEPAAPIATTLKPLMTLNVNEEVTAGPTIDTPIMESLPTTKPSTEIRKRVELSLEAVSLGLACTNHKQCQLADPHTVCNARGLCDCAANVYSFQSYTNVGLAECGAERTGCAPGTFQCRSSGVCISWFFVCDGRSDCNDASDEECTFNVRLNLTCPIQSYQCGQSGRCISRAALCDGRKQCPRGEDEIGCSALKSEDTCPPHTFRCKSGECLPEYEYCNAIISCRDGSDEPLHICGSRSMPNFFLQLLTAGGLMKKNIDTNTYCPHRCSNGRCRSTAIVCSGRDGCGDGTDEQTCSVCRCPAVSRERPPINIPEFLARHRPMSVW